MKVESEAILDPDLSRIQSGILVDQQSMTLREKHAESKAISAEPSLVQRPLGASDASHATKKATEWSSAHTRIASTAAPAPIGTSNVDSVQMTTTSDPARGFNSVKAPAPALASSAVS